MGRIRHLVDVSQTGGIYVTTIYEGVHGDIYRRTLAKRKQSRLIPSIAPNIKYLFSSGIREKSWRTENEDVTNITIGNNSNLTVNCLFYSKPRPYHNKARQLSF